METNKQTPSTTPGLWENSILCAKNLTKVFGAKGTPGVTALEDLSLEVFPGRVTGLVGADGAGKSTLIRIAAGLLVPTSGSMTLFGLDSVANSLEIQSRVGYMPQKFGLYQDLTVMENLRLYADLQGVASIERAARYNRLLAMTDLAQYTKRRAGALSGGMKQKLGLACALIKLPELLLLDEPTVGVDPVSRHELWKIVYELVEKDNIGVLVSTAYLDEAERCSQVLVMHHGRLMAQGPPADFTAALEGRVFLVEPDEHTRPRKIYTSLAGQEGIVDTTIRSGKVRVVVEAFGQTADKKQKIHRNQRTKQEQIAGQGQRSRQKQITGQERITALLNGPGCSVATALPGFEDAFMALIPKEKDHVQAPSSPKAEVSQKTQASKTSLTDATLITDNPAVAGAPFGTDASSGYDTIVSTEKLCKQFGNFTAVHDLNFTVQKGEIFGLLGPNGAGKSTTFRMLCGLLPATSGQIRVAGRNLRKSRAKARARLGYMAQQFSLYGQLSVMENLVFFGKAYGLFGKRLSARILWAFNEFGFAPWQKTPAADLPGGYKQRLAMAAALLHEPDILFLDEPTSGVDPFARREFWLRINRFAEQGVTVIVTTHFMEEAEYCDRMLIMSRGETLAMGTPSQIRSLARSPQRSDPTMDDAFIALSQGDVHSAGSSSHETQPGTVRKDPAKKTLKTQAGLS